MSANVGQVEKVVMRGRARREDGGNGIRGSGKTGKGKSFNQGHEQSKKKMRLMSYSNEKAPIVPKGRSGKKGWETGTQEESNVSEDEMDGLGTGTRSNESIGPCESDEQWARMEGELPRNITHSFFARFKSLGIFQFFILDIFIYWVPSLSVGKSTSTPKSHGQSRATKKRQKRVEAKARVAARTQTQSQETLSLPTSLLELGKVGTVQSVRKGKNEYLSETKSSTFGTKCENVKKEDREEEKEVEEEEEEKEKGRTLRPEVQRRGQHMNNWQTKTWKYGNTNTSSTGAGEGEIGRTHSRLGAGMHCTRRT